MAPTMELEKKLCSICAELLKLDSIGINENFFDIGGNSLLALELKKRLDQEPDIQVSVTDLFTYPTIHALVNHLTNSPSVNGAEEAENTSGKPIQDNSSVAIIGMAGTFTGADNLEQYWQNILDGVESMSRYSDEELQNFVDKSLLSHPNYIKTGPMLSDMDTFDAEFFDIPAWEAEILDPQQRKLLEHSYSALEDAGYGDRSHAMAVGVYVSCAESSYLFDHLLHAPEKLQELPPKALMMANGKDYAATRISYKLNLTGPSVNVNTACSSSLVAIHHACQAIKRGECELAISGGAGIAQTSPKGYLFQSGSILSNDGSCRVFDADSSGTRFGSGVAMIVLKDLEAAKRDGDVIRAVVKGSAINNDGNDKVGYTAPSVAGQSKVIKAALQNANCEADSISYIEAHGTGTRLGDPIEIAGLRKVFESNQKEHQCYLGSVKPNIGHCDTAAGVAGVIKTVYAIKQRTIPPMLNFNELNPEINLSGSGLVINDKSLPWECDDFVRRAGISSFGIGGTNAHMIVEEYVNKDKVQVSQNLESPDKQLVPFSARSSKALVELMEQMVNASSLDTANLPDVARTLQFGRQQLSVRKGFVADSVADLRVKIGQFLQKSPELTNKASGKSVTMVFPGQGAQHLEMGHALYQNSSLYKANVDECLELLKGKTDTIATLKAILVPDAETSIDAETLSKTELAQPSLFIMEYALAKQILALGIKPSTLIGHSLGEYVAACLAGVFSLQDALQIITKRAQLMQSAQPGKMLHVSCSKSIAVELSNEFDLDLAAENSPEDMVLSGSVEAIQCCLDALQKRAVSCRLLNTSHAFHSKSMEPVFEEFAAVFNGIQLQDPKLPVVSNLTGQFVESGIMNNAEYWCNHLRRSVQFSSGVGSIVDSLKVSCSDGLFLQVGPGKTLTSLLAKHTRGLGHKLLNLQTHAESDVEQYDFFLQQIAELWRHCPTINWQGISTDESYSKVALPTYPFQKKRYWIEAFNPNINTHEAMNKLRKMGDPSQWLYRTKWQRDMSASEVLNTGGYWLCVGSTPLNERVQKAISAEKYAHIPLIDSLQSESDCLDVIHSIDDKLNQMQLSGENFLDLVFQVPAVKVLDGTRDNITPLDANLGDEMPARLSNFTLLMHLISLLEQRKVACRLRVVLQEAFSVTGQESLSFDGNMINSMLLVASQETSSLNYKVIDIDDFNASLMDSLETYSASIVSDLVGSINSKLVVYRHCHRWSKGVEQVPTAAIQQQKIKEGGTYLITGGLGQIGMSLCQHLIKQYNINIGLLSRGEVQAAYLEEQLGVGFWDVKKNFYNVNGSKVMTLQADVSNVDLMERAFTEMETVFGSINGVLHAAGNAEPSIHAFAELKWQNCKDLYAAKIRGCQVLDSLIQSRGSIDFVYLMSSISNTLGGLGYGFYAAANGYLDAFAEHKQNHLDSRWQSVAWDGWSFKKNSQKNEKGAAQFHLTSLEGCQVFDEILKTHNYGTVLVSTGPLQLRIDKWAGLTDLESTVDEFYERPVLSLEFQAAYDETTNIVVSIWQKLLKINGIGVDDNFFELGGDSLLLIKVKNRVDESFDIDIPIEVLFSNESIRQLASAIDNCLVDKDIFFDLTEEPSMFEEI